MLSQLSHKDYTFLGERDLISSYRNRIKWNPEDEKCTNVNIRQKSGLNKVMKQIDEAKIDEFIRFKGEGYIK